MNSRTSGILVIICLLLLITNHYIIDWEDSTRRQVIDDFEELITAQYQDLQQWSEGSNGENRFRKRTVCNGKLISWSDDQSFAFENSNDTITLLESSNGLFLEQILNKNDCQYISIYPIYFNYSITNQYLKSGLNEELHADLLTVSKTQGNYTVNELFYFDIKSSPNRLIDAMIALMLTVVILSSFWNFSGTSFSMFVWSTLILSCLRLFTWYYDVFELLIRYPLFDPVNYTASFFNPTLGDFLLNCVLILLFTLQLIRYFDQVPKKYGWFLLNAIGVCLSLLLFDIPWGILNNSQIELDVGNSIQFDTLRLIAYLGILILFTAFLVLVFHLQRYLKSVDKLIPSIIVSSAVALILIAVNYYLSLYILTYCAILFIAWRFSWGTSLKDFNYANLLYILFVAVSLGWLIAFTTYKHGERAELESKKKFANYLLLKRDVLGEYYLDQSVKKLAADSSLGLIASEGSRDQLEEIIRQEFISPYFNKYDFDILFQDYQRLKVNTEFTKEYALLVPENESDYENIYFVEEGTNFKYISKVNFGDLIGLITLQIKKRLPSTVYPALLTDAKYVSINNEFDYAVFAGNEILFHRSKFGQGEWPQNEDFENKRMYRNGIEKNGRHYYGVQTSDGRTILIISKKYSDRALLANFSFFFLLLLSAFGFYSSINSLQSKGFGFNFTSKIQLYLSMAFIVPLLTTGFALLSSLNTSYKEEIDRSYLKQSLYISEILSDELAMEMDDTDKSNFLAEIGNYIQSDISFYNESGNLLATSQPDIFSLGLQGNLVNPIVFEELVEKQNQSMIAEESIGSLDYRVCYAVVNTVDNQVGGFIAMPFFDSKNHLRRQQIEVFENLITIFALIFILAILVGNFVLNNLLQPLRLVANKISQVTLQEVNEPIPYQSSDEIGSLVKDYNRMLIKLEDSKKALAKSQKETAWKEIARQVAHEIKNPLTPMQLKIQQMMRKHEEGSKDYDTLSTLLTQVDTLSQIAESFSGFAEMPAPDNQVFEWNDLIEEVIRLYRSEAVTISFETDEVLCIEADKDIFRRILNNIVLNAIQSVAEEKVSLEVQLTKRSGKAQLSVRDNGKGVPDELKDKIFLNYFSTKSTGSGIGLALAKKGIENAGGNIWFESNQGQGTTFFISMPLVDQRTI